MVQHGNRQASIAAGDVDVRGIVRQVAAGPQHTCVLLDNTQMKCWGSNFEGELGQGDKRGRGGADINGVSTMGNALLPIDLGLGRHATVIAAGGNHSCALLDNAQIKCWGSSKNGELGLENTIPRGTDGDMGELLQPVTLW